MSYWHALIMGILQGLTEFLPVSSSGHLALGRHILGLEGTGITFEVLVHTGTLVSVLVVFGSEVRRILLALYRGIRHRDGGFWAHPDRRLAAMLLAGSTVTGAVALYLEEVATGYFQRPEMVGLFWILTGLVLFSSRLAVRALAFGSRVGLWQALLVGLAQGLAVIPGVSRSGLTITAGLWAGLDRPTSARFSFLLAVPAILAAAGSDLWRSWGTEPYRLSGPYIVGFVAAAASGYVAIKVLLRVLETGHLGRFGYYCVGAGLIALLLGLS